jgi:hypothetical protein
MVLMSRLSGARRRLLLRTGFVPVWPGYRVVFYTADSGLPLRSVRTLQVHLV